MLVTARARKAAWMKGVLYAGSEGCCENEVRSSCRDEEGGSFPCVHNTIQE